MPGDVWCSQPAQGEDNVRAVAVLQPGFHEVLPQAGGQGGGVGLDALARKVLTQALDVALQQVERVGIRERHDGLREVNHHGLALPVQDVVG